MHIYLSCRICAEWYCRLWQDHSYPFPECDMRHKVSKPRSAKAFRQRVGKTDAINLRRNLRGGIRL